MSKFTSSPILQKYAAQGGPEFFFIVNIQVDSLFCLICFFFLLFLFSDLAIDKNQDIYHKYYNEPGSRFDNIQSSTILHDEYSCGRLTFA